MAKWEYCQISVVGYNRKFGAYYRLFTTSGYEQKGIGAPDFDDYENAQAAIIAWLGEQGWEMAAAGNFTESVSEVLFKRPKA